jgi:hypothetical protein
MERKGRVLEKKLGIVLFYRGFSDEYRILISSW